MKIEDGCRRNLEHLGASAVGDGLSESWRDFQVKRADELCLYSSIRS